MSPFTGLESKCISFLVMTTSPYWYLSWGENDFLVSTSLGASKIASYTTLFGHSLLCCTVCLHHTPTSHEACTVHHSDTPSQNDPHPILIQNHQDPSPTMNDHKRPVSNTWISSFPSTSSGPSPTRFLRWPHYVDTLSSPAIFVTGRTLQTLCLTLPLYLQPTYLPLHNNKIDHCVTPSLWYFASLITLQG